MAFDLFCPFLQVPIELRFKMYGYTMLPRVPRSPIVKAEAEMGLPNRKSQATGSPARKSRTRAEYCKNYSPMFRLLDLDRSTAFAFMEKGAGPIINYFIPDIDTLYAGPIR